MIKAVFSRNESGAIDSFVITGHADSSPYGSDIVCAAVSAVSLGTANGIESLAGFEPEIQNDVTNGGFLKVTVHATITGEQSHIAQILLENLLLELQSIAEQYAKYITVTTANLSAHS